MYFVPSPYKCQKCGHVSYFSPSEPNEAHGAPVFKGFVGCPVCWEKFVRDNISSMEPMKKTVDADREEG